MTNTEATTTTDAPDPARAFGLALGIGIIAAVLAMAFVAIVHEGQHLLFVSMPQALGMSTAPAWWTVAVLTLGAVVVLIAQRLPGATGQGPLTGFHFDVGLGDVPSILLAALGSLACGFVLGPEAPLIVLGVAVGALVTRRQSRNVQRLAMLLGGLAAIGSVFGNPFVTAFMVLEFAAMGSLPAVALLPVLVALASSYLVMVGIGSWSGLGLHALSVPGLPGYDSVQPLDLLLGLVVSIVAGLLTAIVRELGTRLEARGHARRWVPTVAALVVTAVAVLLAEAAGLDPVLVLFSGQGQAMTDLVAMTAVGTVAMVLLLKSMAYAVALGGGMRGGPIFPATYLGVAVAVLVAAVFPDSSVSALAATGIAAASAVMTRLPFTSGLLAMLLIGTAGAAIAPFAILGAVIGALAVAALGRLDPTTLPGLRKS